MKRKPFPWLVWVLAAAFFIYQDAAAFAFLTLPLLIVSAIMQLPAGMMVDVLGVRKVLVFAGLLMAIGGVVLAFSYDVVSQETGRFLMGVGASFGFIGFIMATTRYLPERYLASFIGLGLSIGLLAQQLGEIYGGSETLWRPTVFVAGLIAVALSFFLHQLKERSHIQPKQIPLGRVVKVGRNWLAGLALLCFYPIIAIFGDMPALILGFVVGGPIIGILSDRTKRRKSLLLMTQMGTLCAFILNLYFPSFALLFIIGLFASGVNLLYPFVLESNPKEVGGTALGFVTMIAFLGAVFLDLFATLETFPVLLVVSFLATMFLQEPRKKKEKARHVLERLLEKVDEIQRYKKTG